LVTLLLVSLVVFSSTVSIFPIASSFFFISLINPPSPGLLSPSPLWAYYYFLWIPNQLQIIYHLMINLSALCLCPVLFLFGVRLGSLPLVLVAGSHGGCVHWTPPFLVHLVYHILQPIYYSYSTGNSTGDNLQTNWFIISQPSPFWHSETQTNSAPSVLWFLKVILFHIIFYIIILFASVFISILNELLINIVYYSEGYHFK
jgi:hypothetical protein